MAAAQRYNRSSGARVGDEGAPWLSSYSRRKAYIEEVNRRMDALWRDIYQSHQADDTFRAEFDTFMRSWQNFVGGLSFGALLLPSTEEYAARIDKQIEEWRQRFEAMGGKVSMPGYAPPNPPAGPPFPWSKLFLAVAIASVVAGVIYVGSKLPDVPGPRYT